MKSILAMFLFATTALAQNAATAVAPGCGAADAKFDVKADKSQHQPAQPDKGKAVVYFVEDDSSFESSPKPITRLGIDGSWVGANHGNSYFHVTVDPGEHHLCASWQSWVGFGMRETSAAAHFTAEPGQVYFFRVRNTWLTEHRGSHVDLSPLDSDEGQLLTSRYAFSNFRPRQ